MLYCQLTRKMSTVGLFVLRAWKRPGLHARSLLRSAQHSGRLAIRGSGRDSTMAGLWTARQGADGKVRGPCKLCSCLDWSVPSPSRMTQAHGRSRRLACRMNMTFVGFAAALDRSGSNIGRRAGRRHRLRIYKCRVWAPGFEQFEDAELPTEVRDLCMKEPRKRHGVSLLGSTANIHCCMRTGLGQPAEPPTQTIERAEKALATLQSIERFACDKNMIMPALQRRGC